MALRGLADSERQTDLINYCFMKQYKDEHEGKKSKGKKQRKTSTSQKVQTQAAVQSTEAFVKGLYVSQSAHRMTGCVKSFHSGIAVSQVMWHWLERGRGGSAPQQNVYEPGARWGVGPGRRPSARHCPLVPSGARRPAVALSGCGVLERWSTGVLESWSTEHAELRSAYALSPIGLRPG